MCVEGSRSIQRVSIGKEFVYLKPFFGKTRTIRRDAPAEIQGYAVSRKRLWASMGTTFMEIDRLNWRVMVGGGKPFLMNGKHFDPYAIFRNVKGVEGEN